MRKIFAATFSLVLVLSIFATGALASDFEIGEAKVVYEAEGNSDARVEFIDQEKVGEIRQGEIRKGDDLSAMGVISEKYVRSYYQFSHAGVTAYNVGPITNQKVLVSVPFGATKTISQTIEVSGTVAFEGSVSAEIKSIVNIGLTSKVSGTVSGTFSTSTVYQGPPKGYTTATYYGAIDYNRTNVTLKKFDVYDVYNGTIKTGTVEYRGADKLVNSVKKPIVVEFPKYSNH